MTISREQALDMSHAHAEGWHAPPDGLPREGCPDCEDRPLRDYPPASRLEMRARRHEREDLELIREDEPRS